MALLCLVLPAWAAPRDAGARLDAVAEEVGDVVVRMDRLSREYGQRRGLIGAEDAARRYGEAVFQFLMGEHERAAITFYTLVESEALTGTDLRRDSEWYLAESVFELGNWNTALEAYGRIVERGSEHPYFADAVRRQMEIYGITGETDAFRELYTRWILSGRVPATDELKYTLAKSFYRQGENGRAKAMFAEIPPASAHYARARYFQGAVLAEEGDHAAALAEFQRAATAEIIDPEVEQLAWMALGRVHYELGQYGEAVSAYRKLPSTSPHFADQLYELSWTYIKKEAWQEALDSVEIFIVAFPQHRHTLRMKLLQGHLHRKALEYERALASYEGVVDEYSPVQSLVGEWERDRERPAVFFRRLVDEGAADGLTDLRWLPEYAVQLVVDDLTFSRSVSASRELDRQGDDVNGAEATLVEIGEVMASSGDSVGTFNRGRVALQRVRDDALGQRIRLVNLELDVLEDLGGEGMGAELSGPRSRLEALTVQAQALQGAASDRSDRFRVYEDQVRAVQGEASRVAQVVTELEAEHAALSRLLDQKRNLLPVAVVADVDLALKELSARLFEERRDLTRLQSDSVRRTVMASVPQERVVGDDGVRGDLARELDLLHTSLRQPRGRVPASESAGTFSRLDELWLRLSDADARAVQTRTVLDAAEKVELALLREAIVAQTDAVAVLDTEVARASMGAEVLATDVTRERLAYLGSALESTILEADMGIVDVYWLRKSEVVDERTRLKEERADRLQELDTRFGVIRQKLEE